MLDKVEKPARYAGGEYNSVYKNDAEVSFALCFADIYEIGMSHLGMQILYEVLNAVPYVYAERVYCPWVDAVKVMREKNIPLASLETKRRLCDFDIIGVNISYEMCYTNIPLMLELGGVPLRAAERKDDQPVVIAGGACTVNPEPIAPFFDAVVVGEGEEVSAEICALYRSHKNKGFNRKDFLRALAGVKGVYVPSLYKPEYDNNGGFSVLAPMDGAPAVIEKRIVQNFSDTPTIKSPVTPYLNIVHERCTLELMRGCPNGCRFCQAGYVTRPVRERSVENLLKTAGEVLDATGYDEISLCSLSSGDYSNIEQLAESLLEKFSENHVSLSLPSTRADRFKIAGALQRVRSTGVTFAPEAGTQRLRDVINKNITEQDILSAAKNAFLSGAHTVKLYFMVGLPTETQQDLDGIAELVKKVRDCYYEVPKDKRGGRLALNVSASNFVPKPGTPFQWEAMDDIQTLSEKQRYLKDILKIKPVKFNYHDPRTSYIEAVFARGDRRLFALIEQAYKNGAMFDAWQEHFSFDRFVNSAQNIGLNIDKYAKGAANFNAPLPWEHISCGVKKEFLLRERARAYDNLTTKPCTSACAGCGIGAGCGYSGRRECG